MRKSRLTTLLQDYVAGDCTGEQAAEVERLIREDADVRRLLDECRGAHEALRTLRDRPAPFLGAEDAIPAIRAAIARDAFQEKPRLFLEGEGTRFYRRLAAAALLLFAVSISLLALNRLNDPGTTPPPVVEEPSAPVPPERRPGIELILDKLDKREPMTAEELFKLAEEAGINLGETVYTPQDTVVPVPVSAESR